VAFASGLAAGFTTTVVLHPLDLLKTRLLDHKRELKRRASDATEARHNECAPSLLANL
jgi:hypothetical protein